MSVYPLEHGSYFEQTAVLERTKRVEIMLPLSETYDPLSNKLQNWLPRVGLDLNPFTYIDSGKDPLIPFYLVDHDQFDHIFCDQPSFVFAPAGGGKTAFRVRLARECRAGRDGRRIFPIIYKPVVSGTLGENKEQTVVRQRTELLRYAAQELLLHLVYSPRMLGEMNATLKKLFLQIISWDLDLPISYYLNQMNVAGGLEPILEAFDPTARSLPNPPDKKDISYLFRKLNKYHSTNRKPDAEIRLDKLFDLLLNKLGFEAIYILVDGVDAFLETVNSPKNALKSISWLLESSISWAKERIYLKAFLPIETRATLTKKTDFRLLTSMSNIITIKWDAEKLSEVIQQRLQEASGGRFDSLLAISDRVLRASGRSPEDVLIADLRRLKRLSPRSLIRAVNWLFMNHVRDEQIREKLTPQDLIAAREWIRSEYSAKE